MNYYNEFDPKAAAWLRELIKAGLIPAGDVDERSITEIKSHELTKYTQCHFFAGIGGWSLALQLAEWPADRPVWTGSCPCQPFSLAGAGKGNADDRHLWPAFFALIRERRPHAVFGEQVESAIGHGWLDSVSSDLEGEGYAVGAAVLGAHSVGAPHRRQRLYWVAYADQGKRRWEPVGEGCKPNREAPGRVEGDGQLESGGANCALDDAKGNGCQSRPQLHRKHDRSIAGHGCVTDRPMEHPAGDGWEQRWPESGGRRAECGRPNGVAQGDTDDKGPQGRGLRFGDNAGSWSAWSSGVEFIACTDGRKRLIKPGIFPLAHGFPGRVGLLRGSGNAIVPQVAARFIQASEEAVKLTP